MKKETLFFLSLSLGIILIQCEPEDLTVVDDVEKFTALEHVSLVYDSMVYDIGLPPGAAHGTSFDSLLIQDSATYKNPANYSIDITLNVTADNTKPEAEDAKFDGLFIDIVLDTINAEPIKMESEGFEVLKGQTYPVSMESGINLATHRQAGLYIFQQTVDGLDLQTHISPFLEYSLGTNQDTLALPTFSKAVPTRASDETKDFLRQLLASGIFEE